MSEVWEPEALALVELEQRHGELLERWSHVARHAAHGDGRGVAASLWELRVAAREHFDAQERAMRASGYPGYLRHKRAHDGFAARLSALRQIAVDGRGAPARDYGALSAWLRAHLAEEDLPLARFRAALGGDA